MFHRNFFANVNRFLELFHHKISEKTFCCRPYSMGNKNNDSHYVKWR